MNSNPYQTDYSHTVIIGDIVYSSDLKTVISSKKDITSLNLIRGVRCIGKYAFAECKDLVIVKIPETILVIDDFAFCGCTAIKEVHLPYEMEYISLLAFTSFDNEEHGFFLNIPHIYLPKETYFKYLNLLPQYVFDYEYEDYGYSDDEFEQLSKNKNLENNMLTPDAFEFCRIVVKYLMALSGLRGSCPYEVIPDVSVSHSVQSSVIDELLDNNILINRRQLIHDGNIPLTSKFGGSIPNLIKDCVREWITWDSSNTPIDTCENIIEYALTMGIVPMVIWNNDEIEANSHKDFVKMIKEEYGEYPLASLKENRDKSFQDWIDRIESFDALSVFFSVSMNYKKRGYKTDPSLIFDILYTCMMVAFQFGYCYGVRIKRNYIGVIEGELFTEEEMKGGIKTDYFEKEEDNYLFAMRLISQMDNSQFDVLAKECYEADDYRKAYFIRSVPGNFLKYEQFHSIKECVGIRHFVNNNMYSYNKPHVTFPGAYEKARTTFMKEIDNDKYKHINWPDFSDLNGWGRITPEAIVY